ncbi:MAG: hypothetical protein ACLSA6_19730 [Holdemania massiliensis]
MVYESALTNIGNIGWNQSAEGCVELKVCSPNDEIWILVLRTYFNKGLRRCVDQQHELMSRSAKKKP